MNELGRLLLHHWWGTVHLGCMIPILRGPRNRGRMLGELLEELFTSDDTSSRTELGISIGFKKNQQLKSFMIEI